MGKKLSLIDNRFFWWQLLLFNVSIAGYVYLASISKKIHAFEFIMLITLEFFIYFLSLYIITKQNKVVSLVNFSHKYNFSLIVIYIILIRIISITADPIFENDFFRYHWDAKVWASQINPYYYPPDNFFLEHLRDANWSQVTFKNVSTIYPPFSQFIFRIAYEISPNNTYVLKVILMVFEMLTIYVLYKWLDLKKLPKNLILLYSANPLVIKEFANSAHIDAVLIFFIVSMLYFFAKEKKYLVALFWGLAILTKLWPIIFTSLFIRYFNFKHYLLGLVIVVLGYLPFIGAGELLFEGLITFSQFWQFNSSIHQVISYVSSETASKIIAVVITIGLSLKLGLSKKRDLKINDFQVLLGVFLLLGPVVNTWYIVWLLPFLVLSFQPSILLLSFTSTFSYFYYWQNQDLWWIRTIEYTPFYLLVTWQAYKENKKSFFMKK